ncbi:inactive protein RESTRICTED TEV MOVEMENT 2-like [Phragmites australis]|uniref:inactive protein RESTRICTED TEV MOVEMENT 2-like n=1 Tax=Phragmites australis TaxID=29695 RepID=UPI002D776D68|nr:inactive protein RESTRICTED TEV MOVEMENT 2-like [Phragmites australis]
MASSSSSRQATNGKQQAVQELDPKYEWLQNDIDFILRVHLSGFSKEDFKVQVDGAGRLTVRSQRVDGGKNTQFHKVFLLPDTSNLDDISGRFDGSVLTLTVPKRPTTLHLTIKEIKKPKEAETEKDEAEHKEETKKPKDDAEPKEQGNKAEQVKDEVEAKRSKPEQDQKTTTVPPAVRKEDVKPKPEAAAAPTTEKKQADGKRATEAVHRDSPAERVRRRAEEESAKAAAAAEEAERERTAARCCWKVELEGLAGSEWAEGFMETVTKNKEVIAAVAAFSLGLFISSRLFSRN